MDTLSGAIELLAGAISYLLGVCAPIAASEMTLPTPCRDWDLAKLLGHLGGPGPGRLRPCRLRRGDRPGTDPGHARHPDAAAEPAAGGRARGPVRGPGRGPGPGQPGRPAGCLPRARPGTPRGLVLLL